MSKQDFRLNDFEIKTIKLNCPNHILNFDNPTLFGKERTLYTSIIVNDKDNRFCRGIVSYKMKPHLIKDSEFFKLDIAVIIKEINNSKHHTIYSSNYGAEFDCEKGE